MKHASILVTVMAAVLLLLSLSGIGPADAHPALQVMITPTVFNYLPLVSNNWPLMPTSTVTPTPTSTPAPTTDNIPCLFVIARLDSAWRYSLLAGCVTSRGGSREVTFQYDDLGRISGLDVTYIDAQGAAYYRALIEIQRDVYGRVASYGGAVSGDDFPTFTETIVNEYNELGRLIGADVTKVYTASGDEYTMDLIPCESGSSWSGYRVSVWGEGYSGQEFTVGDCN